MLQKWTVLSVSDARRDVVTRVARAVSEGDLWNPGARLVVAVSGGADSLCLLGALLDLREQGERHAPGELIVASLDHGLRGATGADDATWVAALAEELGLRCVTSAVDTKALARARHLSLEHAARLLRYHFLRDVARSAGAARICVAHTEDDQAETLLLHLLRGSGLTGLTGMRALSGDIARPLLSVTRAATEAYCVARGWAPREDATNASERYTRNRIRNSLMPMLATYNPQIRAALARTAASLAADADLLTSLREEAWSNAYVETETTANLVSLRLDALQSQPAALRVNMIRWAIAHLPHVEYDAVALELEARHFALVQRLIMDGATGATLTLPGGLRVTRDYKALRVSHDAARDTEAQEPEVVEAASQWELEIPGEVIAKALGWRVRAAISELPAGLEGELLPPQPDLAPIIHAGIGSPLPRGEWRAYIDADVAGTAHVTGTRLTVRAWRPGDRFRPLGMAHSKKLQDVFADAKVPRAARRSLPLVCAGESIVWVAGVRISDDCKLTEKTKRILILQAEPLTDANIGERQSHG
jgi:tRNA(Ile)-lysidine synthase